ncbi:Ig-like domain-containing protein, partial [Vibrio metoecus]
PKLRGMSGLVLPAGQVQPFAAVGYYSDGTSKNLETLVSWHSDAMDVAMITTPGHLTAQSAGYATISAHKKGVTSNALKVTVVENAIIAVQVTPSPIQIAKEQVQQLTAMATFTDNTMMEVTDTVTWDVEDPTVATVSASGMLSSLTPGQTRLSASIDGIVSSSVNVTVTDAQVMAITVTPPSVNLAKGLTQPLTVTATFDDFTVLDVTQNVVWDVEDNTILSIDEPGILYAKQVGSTTLSASKNGITSNTV